MKFHNRACKAFVEIGNTCISSFASSIVLGFVLKALSCRDIPVNDTSIWS